MQATYNTDIAQEVKGCSSRNVIMANNLVEKIESDFLSCCICFEELRDPVGLPCLHGFCFVCLDRWANTSRAVANIECPVCKKSVPMPKEGIRGFPGHFMVKHLKEAVDSEKVGIILLLFLK